MDASAQSDCEFTTAVCFFSVVFFLGLCSLRIRLWDLDGKPRGDKVANKSVDETWAWLGRLAPSDRLPDLGGPRARSMPSGQHCVDRKTSGFASAKPRTGRRTSGADHSSHRRELWVGCCCSSHSTGQGEGEGKISRSKAELRFCPDRCVNSSHSSCCLEALYRSEGCWWTRFLGLILRYDDLEAPSGRAFCGQSGTMR